MKNYTSSQYVQGKQITYSDNESKQLIKDAKQVTHEQLKQIRDKSTLIPGQWYRITDYVCTTAQENTQSAGHPFDILVRADAADKLNETAYATLHKGDTYFANSKLEAWELKYTIDNDTTRFAWADSENGKGVIYYMKDEWNNECPYDFKNIQFKWHDENDDNDDTYTYCYTISFYYDNSNMSIVDATIKGNDGTLLNDELNITGVYNNIIKESYDSGTISPCIKLSHITCVSRETYEDGIYYGCYNNIFESNCFRILLDSDCHNNNFRTCSYITLKDSCIDNIFEKK